LQIQRIEFDRAAKMRQGFFMTHLPGQEQPEPMMGTG
jgi:hypothetical protein